jgi:hypothetical protein
MTATAYDSYLELREEVREYFDGKKVLSKIGGKRPGKKCGKTYIAADRKCKEHYSEGGKLTEEGKASAQELAGKVRQRKGLAPIDKVSPIGDTKKAESSKGKKMKFTGIVENSGFVQLVREGKLYSLPQTKLSNKYAKVGGEIPEGSILRLKGYSVSQFAKKALKDGFYILSSDEGLKPTTAPEIRSRTVYLHEVHQELAEGRNYQG